MRNLSEIYDQQNDTIYENINFSFLSYQPTNFDEVVQEEV